MLALWIGAPSREIKLFAEMGKNILEPRIWHKIIKRFNTAKLKYILVGGAALVMHGLPRSTLDIDIYIPAQESALKKLFMIAHSLRLQTEEEALLKIAHSPKLFANQWLCFSYQGYDMLDVFLAEESEFDKLYKNSQKKQDKTLAIRVAALEDIKAMKEVSGRPVDISDVKAIEGSSNFLGKR